MDRDWDGREDFRYRRLKNNPRPSDEPRIALLRRWYSTIWIYGRRSREHLRHLSLNSVANCYPLSQRGRSGSDQQVIGVAWE